MPFLPIRSPLSAEACLLLDFQCVGISLCVLINRHLYKGRLMPNSNFTVMLSLKMGFGWMGAEGGALSAS